MSESWLGLYLRDAVCRRLCAGIHCTTCGAQDFRRGVLRALATVSDEVPASRRDSTRAARVALALASVEPDDADIVRMLEATRCLVYDVCNLLGEPTVEGLLGRSWAGEVLRGMQAHERAVRGARRAREEYEGPEATLRRRGERKRLAHERHQHRLLLKQERDHRWREIQARVD